LNLRPSVMSPFAPVQGSRANTVTYLGLLLSWDDIRMGLLICDFALTALGQFAGIL